MLNSKIDFYNYSKIMPAANEDWLNWKWQIKNSLKSLSDFEKYFQLTQDEKQGFSISNNNFKIQTSPYYASLVNKNDPIDPIRTTFMPSVKEGQLGLQQQLDPLAENKNSPTSRVIHRYPDRVLFLVTDICSLYCRYCTRKHFTGKDQAYLKPNEYELALNYINDNKAIREVILSGGDPLTLSNERLEKIFNDLHSIPHIEIIRVGSRIPATLPMRVDHGLIQILKKFKPIYLMTHFNHPNEITALAAEKIELLVDNGVPVMNQMVLLNGVNNHPAIVHALSKRLIYLRAKPYYMFQCDPSPGSDHLRTPVQQSIDIQKKLWGRMSGLAMPNLSLDIPSGGGKAGFTPDFLKKVKGNEYHFKGWDNVEEVYISPALTQAIEPSLEKKYRKEWENINPKA